MNLLNVELRRAEARRLRGDDRAMAAALAVTSFQTAVRQTAERSVAERVALTREARVERVSWATLALGSHR